MFSFSTHQKHGRTLFRTIYPIAPMPTLPNFWVTDERARPTADHVLHLHSTSSLRMLTPLIRVLATLRKFKPLIKSDVPVTSATFLSHTHCPADIRKKRAGMLPDSAFLCQDRKTTSTNIAENLESLQHWRRGYVLRTVGFAVSQMVKELPQNQSLDLLKNKLSNKETYLNFLKQEIHKKPAKWQQARAVLLRC